MEGHEVLINHSKKVIKIPCIALSTGQKHTIIMLNEQKFLKITPNLNDFTIKKVKTLEKITEKFIISVVNMLKDHYKVDFIDNSPQSHTTITTLEEIQEEGCPVCKNKTLNYQEGCLKCPQCSWSACSS